MAQYLGLAGLCVKNESFRFGLNAFKVLGGSFAMAKYIAKEMGRDVSEMTYDYLTSEPSARSSARPPSSPPPTATTPRRGVGGQQAGAEIGDHDAEGLAEGPL